MISKGFTASNPQSSERATLSSHHAFMSAAVGSAVGLGNIWRFPYIAFDSGGGTFVPLYSAALLTASIPLLLFDYAISYYYHGSPPLAFHHLGRQFEPVGWWNFLANVIICIYYAAIVGWAASHACYPLTSAWGTDPQAFFFRDFLQMADAKDLGLNFASKMAGPLIIIWVFTLAIMVLGVRGGAAGTSTFFMPLLAVTFVIMMGIALALSGVVKGLDALFTLDWNRLADPKIWVVVCGQTLFSLSACFGITITYSPCLEKKTGLGGTGLVAGFANGSFKLFASIGIFATLSFMAQTADREVSEVASNGIGLTFIALPTIINQAPMGALIGMLFFGSLVFAGVISMISIVEVVMVAIQDKVSISRVSATMTIGIPMTIISTLSFDTITGLPVLDVLDEFINTYDIVVADFVYVSVIVLLRKLPESHNHLNALSSICVDKVWIVDIVVIVAMLGYMLYQDTVDLLKENHSGCPDSLLNIFDWGTVGAILVSLVLLSFLPWRHGQGSNVEDEHEREREGEE